MLRAIWTPGAAAPPDDAHYRNAIDILVVQSEEQSATVRFPRDSAAPVTGLAELGVVVQSWAASRSLPNAPAKLMVHGFDHDPRHENDANFDPFDSIYGYPNEHGPNARLSWLPLVQECDANGGHPKETAIAFAWTSTGSLAEYATALWSESYEYACIDLAALAAKALAAVLEAMSELRSVDVLAHSLGTRLFTKAVALLANDAMLNNVILLDGAEYSVDAAATFAGRSFGVVNVTNETDSVLSLGGEQLGDPSRAPGSTIACSLGRFGLGDRADWTRHGRAYPANWVDLALNRRDLQAWFHTNGNYSLTPSGDDTVVPQGHMNHWACYTEPGNRRWLTDLLWKPGLSAANLAATPGLPTGVLLPKPDFAGTPVPTTTPMTSAERLRYQQLGGQAGNAGQGGSG